MVLRRGNCFCASGWWWRSGRGPILVGGSVRSFDFAVLPGAVRSDGDVVGSEGGEGGGEGATLGVAPVAVGHEGFDPVDAVWREERGDPVTSRGVTCLRHGGFAPRIVAGGSGRIERPPRYGGNLLGALLGPGRSLGCAVRRGSRRGKTQRPARHGTFLERRQRRPRAAHSHGALNRPATRDVATECRCSPWPRHTSSLVASHLSNRQGPGRILMVGRCTASPSRRRFVCWTGSITPSSERC